MPTVESENKRDTSKMDHKSDDSDFDDFSLDGELNPGDSDDLVFEDKPASAMIQSLPDRNGGFYCTVSIHAGIADTEHHVDLINYFCEKSSTTTTMATTHQLSGDVKAFFGDKEINRSVLFVPDAALDRTNNIVLDQGVEIVGQIAASASPHKGIAKLLIIRISNDRPDAPADEKVTPAYQLAVDFFGKNNRNLRNVYKKCSAKQLKINPAVFTDPGRIVEHGVLTIPTPPNFCKEKNHIQLGYYAKFHNRAMAVYDYAVGGLTNIAYVMPECVNFRGGRAWGQISGRHMWLRSDTASYPVIQVHEFGHNLGLDHSGTKANTYGDPTDYMSSRADWNKEGNKMCFNAAKLAFLDWYRDRIVMLKNSPNTKEQYVTLIGGVDDARRNLGRPNKLVAAVIGKSAHLYMMYNRAKGYNSGVKDFRNKIVIVKQMGFSWPSKVVGALGEKQSFTYPISSNKIIKIKVGTLTKKPKGVADEAKIIVTIINKNRATDSESSGQVSIEDNENSGNWQAAFDRDSETVWNPGTKEVTLWYNYPSATNNKVVAYKMISPPLGTTLSVQCTVKGFFRGEDEEQMSYWQTFDFSNSNREHTFAIPEVKQGLYEKYKLWCRRNGENTGKFKMAEIEFITE